MNENFVL
jgi:CheY-like chemotaxis protein